MMKANEMIESEKERYEAYLCSPEWWGKRNAVMDRASGRCERCGAMAMCVHHLTYIRKYNERIEDLTALCDDCHHSIHRPGSVLSREESEIRLASRNRYLTPLQIFQAFVATTSYRLDAQSFGLVTEYDEAASAVMAALIEHASGVTDLQPALVAKVGLIRLHRTLDRLKGYGGPSVFNNGDVKV